ncbi:MAG: tetraacyldisaccharide 4'-kinase [Candidatus Omnitrophica bacterium]|nr:tetraacyldisaccharide 4'-kinase [Candidatus Omnitrophota bacterium]
MTLRNYFRLLAEDRPYQHQWIWFWKPLLKVASWFYGFAVGFRAFAFRSGILRKQAFPCPVISIGNLTWGGTGKTPLVEYVARFFINRANVPLILARGYGEDESKMFLRQLQGAEFGIGKNRYETGKRILATRKVDVIILDDGFQHWQIKRDLDIVAVNVLNPFGNLSLLPYGILRESLASLKRTSIVVLTDVNLTPRKELEALKSRIRAVAPKIDFVEAHREALYGYRPGSRERIPVDRLQGKRVTSFSGIGTPRSFQMLLNQLGVKTVRNFEFCDHHRFTDQELREVLHAKETSEAEEIITTEKDFFRSEELIRRIVKPIVLKVRLRLTNGETLLHQYLARFAASRPIESHLIKRHHHFSRREYHQNA